MKLRNKKTGGLANIMGNQNFFRVYTDAGWADYHSLAELNEEWEDYKPTEPLIKDERIRKAVRAWAEAEETESAYYKVPDTFESIDGTARIEFGVFGFDEGHYTIAELCGEEQE